MNTTIRLALYVAIAVVSVLLSDFAKLKPEDAQDMYWTQWVVMGLGPTLAGLVAWRAFVDQSISIKANLSKPKSPQP